MCAENVNVALFCKGQFKIEQGQLKKYLWTFFFYEFRTQNIHVFGTLKQAISKIPVNELNRDQLLLIKNLKTLLDFRSYYINIDGFTIGDGNISNYTLTVD